MRRIALVTVIAVALCACRPPTITTHGVREPPGAAVGVTVTDGANAWSILEDGDCVLLKITAVDGRWLSDESCDPYPPFTSILRVQEPEVRFNDRLQRSEPCLDDCAGPPPNITMSSPVLWGRTGPEVSFVCYQGDTGPVVELPNDGGLVLAPVSATAGHLSYPDSVLTFLSDGRYIGPARPEHPELVEACQALGAPGQVPLQATAWPFRIEVPRSQAQSGIGLFISTDTGYLPYGASLSLLADGDETIPLLLHSDSTTLIVGHERDDMPPVTTNLPLPREVTDMLAGARTCADRPILVLHLDDDLTPHLQLEADQQTC